MWGKESLRVQWWLEHYLGEDINKSAMMVGMLCEGTSHLEYKDGWSVMWGKELIRVQWWSECYVGEGDIWSAMMVEVLCGERSDLEWNDGWSVMRGRKFEWAEIGRLVLQTFHIKLSSRELFFQQTSPVISAAIFLSLFSFLYVFLSSS